MEFVNQAVSPTASTSMRNILLAGIYFLLSTIITWWFIAEAITLYYSFDKMLLSCFIAGGKWGIQVVAAIYLLKELKWVFIRRIGFACMVGSMILLPYTLLHAWIGSAFLFVASIALAVLVMIGLYYRAVKQCGIGVRWFWGWIVCLLIAVSLQLFVVF